MKFFTILILSLLLFILGVGYSQDKTVTTEIKWEGLQKETGFGDFTAWFLSFQGALVDPATSLPLYTFSYSLENNDLKINSFFSDAIYEDFNADENNFIVQSGYQNEEIEILSVIGYQMKKPLAIVSFIPIKFDKASGKFKKLVSFTLNCNVEMDEVKTTRVRKDDTRQSVLFSGSWYKIKINESGVYKITYNDLVSYGIDPSSIDPRNIRLYGNGKGMLPERNGESRIDDLAENAIVVIGEQDSIFNENDYILFYGQSPHIWKQKEMDHYFEYDVNLYNDFNYYFLTISTEPGKRIESMTSTQDNPTDTVHSFNFYQVYQTEQINLIESGKAWYSDEFGSGTENMQNYSFFVPNIDTSEVVLMKTEFANRTEESDKMNIRINDDIEDSLSFSTVLPTSVVYARVKKSNFNFHSKSSDINVELEYSPFNASSRVWLKYISINAISNLAMSEGQLLYRHLASVDSGHIAEFHLTNVSSSVKVWDITNSINPVDIEISVSNNEAIYTLPTDSVHEFIAYDGSFYYSPQFDGQVENQNLHGLPPSDLVIVTYPDFYQAAERLKILHEIQDGMDVQIVTIDKIYNEFSSGGQDPTAIRDFLKMLYDSSEEAFPRFLLLMGDGSYDPKERVAHNTNYIPAFQTKESWNRGGSIMTDDFYGFMDDGEGYDASGVLDLGIGRLPVQTLEEANELVDKIESYLHQSEPQYGSWRNQICIVADDEDGNTHFTQGDSLARMVERNYQNYNVNKIYLDAYQQQSTPKGNRYPDVTNSINEHMDNGTLIMNYVGHGGESGWAGERVLEIPDISSWDNAGKLPVFVTATCEFSRFDDPEKRTGGELVLMNNNGGGIALFTTVRLAYSSANFAVNIRFYQHVFEKTDGQYPYMGDIIRDSKPPGSLSTRNFVLLGDPALRIAYPKYDVITSDISMINNSNGDTISALSEVKVSGHISDMTGKIINDFNGLIYPVIYDKPAQYQTLGNDATSYSEIFYSQNRMLQKGMVSVIDGEFTFSFVVPRDIALNYGKGKISYYAKGNIVDASGFNDELINTDASGFNDEFIIGGINTNASDDEQGPQIQLYLNNENFVSGDQVSVNPLLIAYLYDDHGINISGNGIGHDIVAIIDGDYQSAIILNDFFEPVLDEYKKGNINYLLQDISNGIHTLSLKVWDSYNNSSTASIDFVIDDSSDLSISQLMNFPNPFSDYTWFTFKHTRPGEELNVNIQIFDLTGRMVLESSQSFISEDIASPLMEWDGTDASGNPLKSGMYIYSVIVTDEKGEVSKLTQKLLLMKD